MRSCIERARYESEKKHARVRVIDARASARAHVIDTRAIILIYKLRDSKKKQKAYLRCRSSSFFFFFLSLFTDSQKPRVGLD